MMINGSNRDDGLEKCSCPLNHSSARKSNYSYLDLNLAGTVHFKFKGDFTYLLKSFAKAFKIIYSSLLVLPSFSSCYLTSPLVISPHYPHSYPNSSFSRRIRSQYLTFDSEPYTPCSS